MMKKILKTGLWIVISILAIIAIVYILFLGDVRYIFPRELGRIEVNYDVSRFVSINNSPEGTLATLDRIEQGQSCVNIEELEQLREEIEGIDDGYIIYSMRRPIRFIYYYKGTSVIRALLFEYSTAYIGSNGVYGEDNGNVIYFYRVRQEIQWPYDGDI